MGGNSWHMTIIYYLTNNCPLIPNYTTFKNFSVNSKKENPKFA
jgi:hypothetical protein